MCEKKVSIRVCALGRKTFIYKLDVYSGPIQFGNEDWVDCVLRIRGRFYQFAVTVFERK